MDQENGYNCSSKSKNDRLDEFCQNQPCQLFHPAYNEPFSQNLKQIMAACCLITFVVMLIGITKIYKVWIKENDFRNGLFGLFILSTFYPIYKVVRSTSSILTDGLGRL